MIYGISMVCLPIPPLPLYNQQLSSLKTSANNHEPSALLTGVYEGAAQPVPDIVPDNLQSEF
jgi:hypothetical protein